MSDFLRKRKQDQIESNEVREHVVKVRFNPSELAKLDAARGRISRAETLRYLLLNKMPAPVPTLNSAVWLELSRASSNLNQIAAHLNGGVMVDLPAIRLLLDEFRAAIIGART